MKSVHTAILSFNLEVDKDKLAKEFAKLGLSNAGVMLPFDTLPAEADMESFGWYGQSNNANVYQDIKVKDLMPKPEDFVKVPFRLISATVVGADSWKVTDFGNEAILKASMSKLLGKPVYPNHDSDDVFNFVGLIESVKWSEARMQDGQMIPAGIDGVIAIDGKTNPKLARGVLMGAIYSNSVTVSFNWEPSHYFESQYEFYDRLGTIYTDGRMVRRIVTEILDYYESSLVWLGADPFAKAIDKDGNLKNIDSSAVYVGFNKEDAEVKGYEADKSYKISFGCDKNVLSLLHKSTFDTQTKSKNVDMKDLLKLLKDIGIEEAQLRLNLNLAEGQELTADHIKQFMSPKTAVTPTEVQISVLPASLAANETAIKAFGGTITPESDFSKVVFLTVDEFNAANVELEVLKKDATIGKDHINAKRAEIKRLYSVTVGEADDSVLKLIDSADVSALDGLLKQYTKGATQKFEGKCKKCGSQEFDFQSSLTEGTDTPKTVKTSSFEDIYEKLNDAGIKTQVK